MTTNSSLRLTSLYRRGLAMSNEPMKVNVSLVDSAMEAADLASAQLAAGLGSNLAINQNGTPMRIAWLTDEMIEKNKLQPVESAIMFEHGNVPTPDGLFSYKIFGETAEERKKTCAYIDLRRKFFHPYAYAVLCELVSKTPYVCSGMGTWAIVDGKLVPTREGDDNYDPNATGIRWLIDHFHDLKFEKNKSQSHNEYVDLLTNSKDSEIFISKWLVIPVFYRDANFSGHKRDIPEENDMYKRLIQLTNALRNPSMANYANHTEFEIQKQMVKIRVYGQTLIEGKRGFLKQNVLGKTTAYAARSVISQPIYKDAQTPDDIAVDLFHSTFPIATCCSMAYPFIESWILNFFANEFETREKKQILVEVSRGKYELQYAKIGDVLAMYNTNYIEKKVEQFMHTYGSRFEPLEIPMEDGSMAYMLFTGRPYSKDPLNKNAPPMARRAMTWTDLLYLATVETLEYGGKMAYITRYPLEDYFGTFPTMIRVSSTLEHEPMEYNGRRYPFYPKVQIGITQDEASTRFIETVNMDNMMLAGIGGDYDGDTISEKATFTEEANDEAFQIMNDPKNFVTIAGQMARKVGNETFLTWYNMTRR